MAKKDLTEKITKYIADQYAADPEYPWDELTAFVFRHRENRKWFALVMYVRRELLGIPGKDMVPVMNLKIDDFFFRDMILQEKGILPAYHMNKQHWISVLLDGTVPEAQVKELLDVSFQATAPRRRKKKERGAESWVVPANPKYYDVESAFEKDTIIDWKQGAGIQTGDTVYLYVGAPVSAILYQCKVLETDIPYDYSDKNLTIKALMKIQLLKCYDRKKFTFSVLGEDYGVFAIRGPRRVPNALQSALEEGGKKVCR